MSDIAARKPVPIESRRIPLDETVVLTDPGTGFSREVGGINVSMSGMFVGSSELLEPGSVVDFRFDLAEGLQPIRGRAEVVWTRQESAGSRLPKGMGMRFHQLDAECRRRIRQVVETMVRETEAPPELRELRMVVEETLEDILSLDPAPSFAEEVTPAGSSSKPLVSESRAMVARSELGGSRWVPILGIALLVLLVSASSYFWTQNRGGSSGSQALDLEAPPLPASIAEGGEASEVRETSEQDGSVTRVPSPPVETEPRVEPTETDAPSRAEITTSQVAIQEPTGGRDGVWAEVQGVVSGWAGAWSSQDVSAYLSYYDPEFAVPGGLSRNEWEQQRQVRITKPNFVKVSLVGLEVTPQGQGEAIAQFIQSYKSDQFDDQVRKTLQLVRREEGWKIREEISE